jgi:SAM-dependent methyltransferase
MESHLEQMRRNEFEVIRRFFPPSGRVLEVGGGSGFQASLISAMGCDVTSIDVVETPAAKPSRHPVQLYDGHRIPFDDASFDIVFSSNVLEHVENLDEILIEVRRVLKLDGLAIHILPTPTWRFWTSVTTYGWALKTFRERRGGASAVPSESEAVAPPGGRRGLGRLLRLAVYLPLVAHGAYPTAGHELYYYRSPRWRRVFTANGFLVVEHFPAGLLYTGSGLFPRWSLATRRRLARVLGSTCHVWIMRP